MPTLPRRRLLQGLAASSLLPLSGALAAGDRPDVLFISIDDLNDWAGILGGHPQARTPNLDALAARGLSFTNAHCAAPACNPSRAAVLTGRHPTTSGVYDNDQPFRRAMPDVATLPQLFRAAGYRALGCGKVFHAGDPASWDEHEPEGGCGLPAPRARAFPAARRRPLNGIAGMGSFDWGPARSRRDGATSDDHVADQVVRWLKKEHDQPIFIGCGFFRPHLPWYLPRKWFELFPLEQIELPLVREDDLEDIPEAGRRLVRLKEHQKIVQSGQWKAAVQAYLASVAFADAMLGRVIEALVDQERMKRTVIVVWSDHGWSLGTKFHWKKFALWEECTRVPLVVKAPGVTDKGAVCSRPVGLLDIGPTLLDLCGIPAPETMDGQSLRPLLSEPGRAWDRPVLTTHGRGNHALRSERWRYIRYADGSEELYDHQEDPHEWTNLARDPARAAVKAELARFLPRSEAAPAPEGEHECAQDGD